MSSPTDLISGACWRSARARPGRAGGGQEDHRRLRLGEAGD